MTSASLYLGTSMGINGSRKSMPCKRKTGFEFCSDFSTTTSSHYKLLCKKKKIAVHDENGYNHGAESENV